MRNVGFISIRTNGVDVMSIQQVAEEQVAGLLDPPDANLLVYAVALVGGVMRIAVASVDPAARQIGVVNEYDIKAQGVNVGVTQKII